MSNQKPLTVEDYEKAAEEFFPKYWLVSNELGVASPEEVLKVMAELALVADRQRKEELKNSKEFLIGFTHE